MWKTLNNNSYFLRFYSEPQKYSVFVTDFMKIWCNYYSVDQFLDNLKKSNFILVNIDDTELLEKGSRILLNPEEANVSVNTDGTLKISMSAQYGYPFSLNLQLNEGLNDLFFQMVTQPLLKSVCDLQLSEQELILELQKKDKEIQEYKAEGGKIALKHLKTKPFNKEEHCSRYRVYKDNFCLSAVPQEIIDKQVSLKQEVNDTSDIKSENVVKMEPVTIKEPEIEIKNEVTKTEPDTQSQSIISPRKGQKRKFKL